MSRALDSLQLINLDDPSGAGDFVFRIFPRQIDTEDKANYEQLDVAGFTKPLSFSNNDPQVIEIPEAWLDSPSGQTSVLPDIERLRALMRRPARAGGELADAPPALELICGDWHVNVVLVTVKAERTRFTHENVQTRAKLRLTFWETQATAAVERAPGSRPEDARFSF